MNGKAPKPFGFFVAGNQQERKQLLHGCIKLKISLMTCIYCLSIPSISASTSVISPSSPIFFGERSLDVEAFPGPKAVPERRTEEEARQLLRTLTSLA
jgi:hypothetical protein